jgi:hypothetical protein
VRITSLHSLDLITGSQSAWVAGKTCKEFSSIKGITKNIKIFNNEKVIPAFAALFYPFLKIFIYKNSDFVDNTI